MIQKRMITVLSLDKADRDILAQARAILGELSTAVDEADGNADVYNSDVSHVMIHGADKDAIDEIYDNAEFLHDDLVVFNQAHVNAIVEDMDGEDEEDNEDDEDYDGDEESLLPNVQ